MSDVQIYNLLNNPDDCFSVREAVAMTPEAAKACNDAFEAHSVCRVWVAADDVAEHQQTLADEGYPIAREAVTLWDGKAETLSEAVSNATEVLETRVVWGELLHFAEMMTAWLTHQMQRGESMETLLGLPPREVLERAYHWSIEP